MPLLDVFWSMLWFFLFIAWISLLIYLFTDIFHSPDLSGLSKAGWTLFLIILPLVGAIIYLIARGSTMDDRAIVDIAHRNKTEGQNIWDASGTDSTRDEIAKLAALKDEGVLSEEEFAAQKKALLGG